MNFIIGGLLMFTLVSTPLTRIDYIAYEIYKKQNQIITAIKSYRDSKENTIEEIDELIGEIDKNAKTINHLLKEKNTLNNKLSTVMDLFMFSNKSLSEQQMDNFKTYSDFYREQGEIVKQNLSMVKNENYFKKLSREILINKENYSKIYEELTVIYNYQVKAIDSLNSIIDCSLKTLAVF